jgi:undecaprenyl-diphosphatase
MNTLQAIVLAVIIEGITEFYLFLLTYDYRFFLFFGLQWWLFTITIVIQLFLVVVLYFKRFFQTGISILNVCCFYSCGSFRIIIQRDWITKALSRLPFLFYGIIVLLKVGDWFNHSEDSKVTSKSI